MAVRLEKLYYGTEEANAYVLGEEGEPCLLIDPGYDRTDATFSYVERHHGRCLGILLTHGHADHFAGVDRFPLDVPLYIHEADLENLFEPRKNCSFLFDKQTILNDQRKIITFVDGEILNVGKWKIQCIHTPFHTQGSSCFLLKEEGMLFSGDSLFRGGIGRTDLPGGRHNQIRDSLRKLAALPDETKVYPGHGPSSTIGNERLYNPFLR